MGDQDMKKNRVMVPRGRSMIFSKSMGSMPTNKGHTQSMGLNSMSRMKLRRMSYGFGRVGGIEVGDNSHLPVEFKRPQLLYLSTYQLDPHPDQSFYEPSVTRMANYVLDELWNDHKYNISEFPSLALRVADEMMRQVKMMAFNRYRVISVVTVGEKRFQSYNNAISFLWDYERDRYLDFTHLTLILYRPPYLRSILIR